MATAGARCSASLRTGQLVRPPGSQEDSDEDPRGNLVAFSSAKVPEVVRLGLKAGPLSVWLHGEWHAREPFVICIDARHAKAVLSKRINKTDRNDAAGLAKVVQTGWYRAAHVKSGPSHLARALLASAPSLRFDI